METTTERRPPTSQSNRNLKKMAAKAWLNDASVDAPSGPPKDPKLREACDDSLELFLRRMFPKAFPLEFSPTHLRMIREIQHATDEGGLKAIAAPRGTGKTTILLRAAIWAVLTGRRRYVCIVAADETSACGNLTSIKIELEFNEHLIDQYPMESWCLRQLNGEPRRAANQMFAGQRTGVRYEKNLLNFGTVDGVLTSGAVISTVGITGRIRGQQSVTHDGDIVRPDFVLVDDPSTKVSAGSVTMNKKRHSTMMSDVLGLAGPGVDISGFCSCTVIYKDDLADRLLDRALSPDWNGDRVQMIVKWPKWMAGWQEWNQIRVEEMEETNSTERSDGFVREHFDRLHEDSEVYWEDRKSPKDLSALHHAMGLYFRDNEAFLSEYQNAPLDDRSESPFELYATAIARRINGLPRGHVPDDVDKITAFIDVQSKMLYYVVMAWSLKGRGYVIDYGGCPDQERHHWTKVNADKTLASLFGDDFETYLRTGVEWLADTILTNEYQTESGAKVSVDRLMIDGRWGDSTKILRDTVKESKHRARMNISMGMYVGATSKKWQQLKQDKKYGEKKKRNAKGIHAKFVVPDGGGPRELMYDTNFWKTMTAERLICPIGSPKAITLFNDKPHVHLMFGEHCQCEEAVRVTAKNNTTVTEWRQPLTSSPENDFWDCLIGNAAVASTLGVEIFDGNKTSGVRNVSGAIEKILKSKGHRRFGER